jgi:Tol biopolymer transport system component/DNA-binding winged helix-turn-helix (wHTH) protein
MHRQGTPVDGDDTTAFVVGTCRVEPRELRVHRDGTELRLEPRIMQVLLALARRGGSTISRDELLAEAWPGLVVSDDAIHRAIYRLRSVLSEDPRTDPVIETVPKVGYRLIKPIRPLARDAGPTLAAPAARAAERAWLPATLATLALVAAMGIMLRPAGDHEAAEPGAEVAPRWSATTLIPALEHMPTYSADGQQLVFSRADGPGREHLWLHPLTGAPAVQLTFGAALDYGADWSASGDRIAFLRQDARRCQLMVMSLQAREPRAVGDCTFANGRLSLSPDGRQLLLSDRPHPERSSNALFVIDVESGERRVLTSPPQDHGDYRPRWSPDGAWIAFTRVEGRYQSSVYRMRADGSGLTRVWAPAGYVHQVDWRGPQALIATLRETGVSALWHVPLRGEAVRLTEIDEGAPSIDVSPDGRALALSVLTPNYRNRRADRLAPGAEPRVTSMPPIAQRSHEVAVSPDGTLLAMEFETRGESSLWLSDLDGGQVRRLWRESGAYIRDLSWDHAGRRVAFERTLHGRQTICIAKLDGEATCLPDTGKQMSPSWSRDDRHLYFASETGGDWFVQRARCDGSEAQRVGTRQAVHALESDAGDALYLRLRGVDGILRVDLRGGEERLIAPDAPYLRPRAFAATAAGLYYLRGDGMLMHLSAASGKAREVLRIDGKPPRTLSAPRDGRFVLFTQTASEDADIGLLTNLDQLLSAGGHGSDSAERPAEM